MTKGEQRKQTEIDLNKLAGVEASWETIVRIRQFAGEQ